MRVLLGAFGDPGHAFPMLALGEALVARGHTVCLQTWRRWEEATRAAGMQFAAAPEYQVFPTRERPLKPYAAAVRAARETVPAVEAFAPDVAVADIITLAPALAAELCEVPVATLVPHVLPLGAPGLPPFPLGARPPRTRAGAALWRAAERLVAHGLALGRAEYNECRARLGLAPRPWLHGGLSRELTLVATLPQLEYPREWPGWAQLVGPLLWEPPAPPTALPPGEAPLVLVATSTSQDPRHELLRAALTGLARAPVRVLAVLDTTRSALPVALPANATVVPWLSYRRTMPACDLVVTHGGHGTLARALVSGCPVLVCPAGGDMPENAARAQWAGAGTRLPRRLLGPRTLRRAALRALADPGLRERADGIAAWARGHDAPAVAARAVERWAGAKRDGRR